MRIWGLESWRDSAAAAADWMSSKPKPHRRRRTELGRICGSSKPVDLSVVGASRTCMACVASVSETIRKPPLVKTQTAFKKKTKKYGEERFSIWRIEFLHPAMWYVGLGRHAMEFAQTSAILEFYIWFPFRPYHCSRHVILHQFAKFYLNRTTLDRKKWRNVDFQDGWSQPSWFLGVQ